MRLVNPTDFEILEALADHGRNTAQNISLLIEKDRQYINSRLPQLTDYELTAQIGPADNSGLYELTDRGQIVVHHWQDHNDPTADFDTIIAQHLDTDATE